jgi:hypothetical protein
MLLYKKMWLASYYCLLNSESVGQRVAFLADICRRTPLEFLAECRPALFE